MEILIAGAQLIGIVVGALAAIGGLLVLPEQLRKFRATRYPLGRRGTGWVVMQMVESDVHTDVDFLVVDDVFHFLNSFCTREPLRQALDVQAVGELYRVRIRFPPGPVAFLREKKR